MSYLSAGSDWLEAIDNAMAMTIATTIATAEIHGHGSSYVLYIETLWIKWINGSRLMKDI
jgi:hypothetical protein